MSNAIMNLDTYKDICDAVREKTSETSTYTASELPDKIRNIQSGGMPISVSTDYCEQVTHLDNYPDLSNLQTSNGEVYFVYDNRSDGSWYGLLPYTGTTVVELGHVENNVFVSDTVINNSLASGTRCVGFFSDLNCTDDFPIIRTTNASMTYWTFLNSFTLNGVSCNSQYSTVVEVIADLPSFVGVANGSTSRVTTYTEKITLKNFTTKCKYLYGMFYMGYNLREINTVNCDFSENIYITHAFNGCYYLGDIDLYALFGNMPKVVGIGNTFTNCKATKIIDLSALSGCKITSLGATFSNCISLKQIIGINNLDTINCTTYSSTFSSCHSLEELDISNWVVGNKCTSLAAMFQSCYSLKKLKVADSWNTSNVTTIDKMFNFCYSLIFDDTLRGNIGNWNLTKLAASGSGSSIFAYCYSLDGTLDLSGWTTPTTFIGVTSMFSYCYSIKKIILPSMDGGLSAMFQNCYSLEEIEGFDRIRNTKGTSYANMFAYCYSLKEVDLSFITDTSLVTTMNGMFQYCYSLKDITFPNITYNTAKLTNIGSMFRECHSLKSVTIPFPISANIPDPRNLFDSCTQLEEIHTTWDMTKFTSFSPTFTSCFNLKSLTYSAAPKISWSLSAALSMPKTEIVRILNTLPTVTSKTLTLGQIKAKLTADEIAIATSKGWTVA